MLESGSSGSVRGVLSNEHSYREPGPQSDIRRAKRNQVSCAGPMATILVA